MPRKNKQSSTASNLLSAVKGGGDDDDNSSVSSVSTMGTMLDKSMNNLSVKGSKWMPYMPLYILRNFPQITDEAALRSRLGGRLPDLRLKAEKDLSWIQR